MAEALARRHFVGEALAFGSAGLAAVPGEPASAHAEAAVAAYGASLGAHRARRLDDQAVAWADLILTMTEAHRESVLSLFPDAAGKVWTLGAWVRHLAEAAGGATPPGGALSSAWGDPGALDIPDPFGLGREAYERTAEVLDALLSAWKAMWYNEPESENEPESDGLKGQAQADAPQRGSKMRVAIGADHGGYALKETIKAFLTETLGHEVIDVGTHSEASVDYPDYAFPVAEMVARGEADRGVLICGTGIGMAIAANKVSGVRAALVHDLFSAKATRAHNDSNVLTMGGRVIGPDVAKEIVRVWLETPFDGGRHARRIDKIAAREARKQPVEAAEPAVPEGCGAEKEAR
ncbi:MAG: ribose 5-phosphate isomerase B [Hydrogenibacillus sp.]|nr:ribose 5-phosphate isomerase B [Hydrogenibacillus sp.]